MRNLPRWHCCRGCSFGGVWSGIRPTMYTYQGKLYTSTQGQNSLLFTRQTRWGTPAHQDSSTTMPISKLGPHPVAPQVHQPKPTQHQQQHPTRQQPQQKEHYHSGPLHARYRRKVQETLQKERNTGTLQGHQYTQKYVRQPQRQGPKKNQPNRHHLPLQESPNKLPQCLHRRIRQITRRNS